MAGNLIPQSERTKEEQREIARKGGIASGKARRAKKTMRETAEILLSLALKSGKETDIEAAKSFTALSGKNITVQEAIVLKQVQAALKGDRAAAKFVRDISGQKPKEQVQLAGEINNPFAGLTTEELKKLIDDD